MVSFGLQIEASHSPSERVGITAVQRFWRLVAGVVDELSATTATGRATRTADGRTRLAPRTREVPSRLRPFSNW
jgi:hypothetical protein